MNWINAIISFGGGGATLPTKHPSIYEALNIQPIHFWIIIILLIGVIYLSIKLLKKK